ncbi:MAG: CoA-transferase [Actinobacteria bacterium]|nr:CoA-transferase [Actinomycetota bacterium]
MSPPAQDYSPMEQMIVAASREIADGEVVFVGMRMPMLAFMVAKRLHAPRAVAYFECGLLRETLPAKLLYTLADPAAFAGAGWATQTTYVLGQLAAGRVDVALVGGAQVDRFGNINTTYIGDSRQPTVRLPGGGGASDFASLAGRLILMMPHERRRFVPRVDYITSPGYGDGNSWRERMRLPGGGPSALVTTLGLFRFNESGEAYLASYHPHASAEQIAAETGWPLALAPDLGVTPPPTREELSIIREYDPVGFWTGRDR